MTRRGGEGSRSDPRDTGGDGVIDSSADGAAQQTRHATVIHYARTGYLLHGLVEMNTHPFNGPFSGTTWVSRYRKGKTNLDFTEARDSEWQWHQLGHMQVCTWLQTDNHASTPPLSFFTGRMPFVPPNKQRQRAEGTKK